MEVKGVEILSFDGYYLHMVWEGGRGSSSGGIMHIRAQRNPHSIDSMVSLVKLPLTEERIVLCFAAGVPLQMKCEMVRTREGAITRLALEWPGSCVFSKMSRQLVGSSELPRAAVPGARIRLLSRVRPLVCFQVRTLGVDLVATGMVAFVNTLCRFFAPSSLRRGILLTGGL